MKLFSLCLILLSSVALVNGASFRDVVEREIVADEELLQFYNQTKNEARELQGAMVNRMPTIAQVVMGMPQFADLYALLAYCDRGLLTRLRRRRESLTLFAPRNYAFTLLEKQIGEEEVEKLVTTREVCNVLLYHIVPGELRWGPGRNLWNSNAEFPTLNPGVRVHTSTGVTPRGLYNIFVEDVRVVDENIEAVNGYVHMLNQVLVL